MSKFRDRVKNTLKYIKTGTPQKHTAVNTTQLTESNMLTGHRILISGGDCLLGQTFARICLEKQAHVAIMGTNMEALQSFSDSVKTDRLFVINHDISDAPKAWVAIKDAAEAMGGIDSLVHADCQGAETLSYETVSVDAWNSEMDKNLKGVYFLTQSFVRYYSKYPHTTGKILFVGSERAFTGDTLPAGLAHSSLTSLTRGLAKKLILRGIRVNALIVPSEQQELSGNLPDVASFLLSEAANCISGTIVPCGMPGFIS